MSRFIQVEAGTQRVEVALAMRFKLLKSCMVTESVAYLRATLRDQESHGGCKTADLGTETQAAGPAQTIAGVSHKHSAADNSRSFRAAPSLTLSDDVAN